MPPELVLNIHSDFCLVIAVSRVHINLVKLYLYGTGTTKTVSIGFTENDLTWERRRNREDETRQEADHVLTISILMLMTRAVESLITAFQYRF